MRGIAIGIFPSVIIVAPLGGSKTVGPSKTLGPLLAEFPWTATVHKDSAMTRVGLAIPGQLVNLISSPQYWIVQICT